MARRSVLLEPQEGPLEHQPAEVHLLVVLRLLAASDRRSILLGLRRNSKNNLNQLKGQSNISTVIQSVIQSEDNERLESMHICKCTIYRER